jgi:hypothetical protein
MKAWAHEIFSTAQLLSFKKIFKVQFLTHECGAPMLSLSLSKEVNSTNDLCFAQYEPRTIMNGMDSKCGFGMAKTFSILLTYWP